MKISWLNVKPCVQHFFTLEKIAPSSAHNALIGAIYTHYYRKVTRAPLPGPVDLSEWNAQEVEFLKSEALLEKLFCKSPAVAR